MLGLWLIYALAKKHGGELQAWRAAAVFSTSLVSIVVTGHHGNTDSACAVLTLAAVALIADGRRPFVAGLAFAAALNVKLIPLARVARGRPAAAGRANDDDGSARAWPSASLRSCRP